MTLHEFGHFLASVFVHAKQISIHHNYSSNLDAGLPLRSLLFIKAAGPLASIIIGLSFHLLCFLQSSRNILFLFKLYMSGFGYIGFFGYLMISPLFEAGDTGYICHALGLPLWITTMIGLAGAITLYFLMASLMKHFVEMGSNETIENKQSRRFFLRHLLLYPVPIGAVILTLLNLPIPAYLSLIAPVCTPFTFLWAYGNGLHKKYEKVCASKSSEITSRVKPAVIIFFILIIIINRLLVAGIRV